METRARQNEHNERRQGRRPLKYVRIVLGLLLIARIGGATEQGAARIYRCDIKGQINFTDRPCEHAPGAEVQLSPVNSYQSEAGPGLQSRKTVASARSKPREKRPESIAEEQQKKKQRCQRLADQLDGIRFKMRSGYTAEQGEKMRDRQRQLERQRRSERCG